MTPLDPSQRYDLAVIGGGIMGCAAALTAAQGGLKTVVIEKSELGSGASGVNAGTLSLQIKRVKLMPYAIKGHEIWEHAGDKVGFRRTGGLTLAFTEAEAERLTTYMAMKKEAGAPIEMKSPAEVADMEPGLNKGVVLASYCGEDGYANSSMTGVYYRKRLSDAGITAFENLAVEGIDRDGGFVLKTARGVIRAKRILISCGGWVKEVAAMVGVDLPVRVRINTVSVTERCAPVVSHVIGHATGLLTLKQKANGTVLIGGGWQGRGTPAEGRGEVVADSLLTNIRLAQFAVPALGSCRITRIWTGFEANVPDFYPLAGALDGVPDAFILACVRGGYTIGPYMGHLMGQLILGGQPEMPLFDPNRFAVPDATAASAS
ncbi:sarcosine oxidase subunit beta [Agaricicola taiwanensis]|uniref:Sarcosine oxidase subunit beta n=1 Tax=Agaricicola taiwanensis TaxID=591372 RepID=A0A8J2YK62_9RHOB|nr:FAD-binding oxidoreductase [Agaricicola taiwanensis]GGE50363.1 sarcosine oxidase subunit beta [Agaricicola taiwanensis]